MSPGGKSAAAALTEPFDGFVLKINKKKKKGVAEAERMPVANR